MSKKIIGKFVPKSNRSEITKNVSKQEEKQDETTKPTKQPAEYVPFVCPEDIDDQIAKAAEAGQIKKMNDLCIMRRRAKNAEKRSEKTAEQQ